MIHEKNDRWRVERVARLIDLNKNGVITDAMLVSQLARLMTRGSIDEMVSMLPQRIRQMLIAWGKEFTDTSKKKIALWPMPREAEISFRDWLGKHTSEFQSQ